MWNWCTICSFPYSVCLWIVDFDSRVIKKKAGLWDEMILKVKHFAQGPYNQLGGSQKDQSSHWRLWWGADPISDFMLASLDDTGLPKWSLLSKPRSRSLFRRRQQLKMAEQFILKECYITSQCCGRYSECSMDDREPFSWLKIYKPLLLISALWKQRDPLGNHKHTSIGGRGGCITVTWGFSVCRAMSL